MATNALTKLITVDKADFILPELGLMYVPLLDTCAQFKRIHFSLVAGPDEIVQRVLDDYDKYKYYFSMMPNTTSAIDGCVDSLLTVRNYTGFNKVAWIDQDSTLFRVLRTGILDAISNDGFEVVYQNSATWLTTDFTSYFAAIEASGAEVLWATIYGPAAVPFVKEYCDRQSPFILWGDINQAQLANFWDLTEAKCEYISYCGLPTIAGYPLTSKTLATKDAYFQRWQGTLTVAGTAAYDAIRFILPDAIRRAGTIETEAVIKTLETVNVEVSTARHFVFTSSHGVYVGSAGPNRPDMDYMLVCLFQWQNGVQIPVYPEEVMKEAGVTFKYPSWQGPWTK